MYAHYGLGQSAQTLTEIGAALGLTAERARQIESAALRSCAPDWPSPRFSRLNPDARDLLDLDR